MFQASTVVLDTNVLLCDPTSINSFPENRICIPISVIEELDALKNSNNGVGQKARQAIRKIEEEQPFLDLISDPLQTYGLDPSKPDNRIVICARSILDTGYKVALITNDAACRIKARQLGVDAYEYETQDQQQVSELYQGWIELYVSKNTVDLFFSSNGVTVDAMGLQPNQFVLLRDETYFDHTAIGRHIRDGLIVPLKYSSCKPWDISPRNLHQRFFLEALMNPQIQLVSATGIAGSGKTLLAIAAGGYQAIEQEMYSRLVYYKHVVPIGRDLGALPGDKTEKLDPWMSSAYDAFEFILGDTESLRILMQKQLVELSALTYIRGRSLPNMFIIVDEAQNISPGELKTLVSRAGQGTKVVLLGDPTQIDNYHLDTRNNGLSHVIRRMKGQPLYAHIHLPKSERSELAQLAASLL